MHGVLLAGLDRREPGSSWRTGIGGRPTMERPLAIARRESPGYRRRPPLRLLPACGPPRRMGLLTIAAPKLVTGPGAIAAARTTAARWPRSGSWRRSGRRPG